MIAFLWATGRKYVVAAGVALPCLLGSMEYVLGECDPINEPITPLQEPPVLDQNKLELGLSLFADTILSGKGGLSCSSCHDLTTSGTVNLKRTIGYNGQAHNFNAPTIFNVANNYRLGWRGNFTSLAAQNEQVLLDRNIMSNDWPSLLKRLGSVAEYQRAFFNIYGEGPSRENLLDVLVTFQKSLATPDSRFDLFLKGQSTAISVEEKRGYELFQEYGCISCHQGSNIGGNMFQKFGIFASPPGGDEENPGNSGRFSITHHEADMGYFRVPSLRNVAVTGPYFHDGRATSLDQAVKIMAETQLGETISPSDVDAIVQFLGTLTGKYHGDRLIAARPPATPMMTQAKP